MADLGENLCSPDLKEEETVLAVRLAEALRADEVETFLEIYDSIPCSTNRKRVSLQISKFENCFGCHVNNLNFFHDDTGTRVLIFKELLSSC